LADAVVGAGKSNIAVIVAGSPEEYESEGFDREPPSMPESHVAEANPNTVVVLVGGAPVKMPWVLIVKRVAHGKCRLIFNWWHCGKPLMVNKAINLNDLRAPLANRLEKLIGNRA